MLDSDGIDDGMELTLGPSDGLLEGIELGMELTLGFRLGASEGLVDGLGDIDGIREGPADGSSLGIVDTDGSELGLSVQPLLPPLPLPQPLREGALADLGALVPPVCARLREEWATSGSSAAASPPPPSPPPPSLSCARLLAATVTVGSDEGDELG